jgi:hypothetical protein
MSAPPAKGVTRNGCTRAIHGRVREVGQLIFARFVELTTSSDSRADGHPRYIDRRWCFPVWSHRGQPRAALRAQLTPTDRRVSGPGGGADPCKDLNKVWLITPFSPISARSSAGIAPRRWRAKTVTTTTANHQNRPAGQSHRSKGEQRRGFRADLSDTHRHSMNSRKGKIGIISKMTLPDSEVTYSTRTMIRLCANENLRKTHRVTRERIGIAGLARSRARFRSRSLVRLTVPDTR